MVRIERETCLCANLRDGIGASAPVEVGNAHIHQLELPEIRVLIRPGAHYAVCVIADGGRVRAGGLVAIEWVRCDVERRAVLKEPVDVAPLLPLEAAELVDEPYDSRAGGPIGTDDIICERARHRRRRRARVTNVTSRNHRFSDGVVARLEPRHTHLADRWAPIAGVGSGIPVVVVTNGQRSGQRGAADTEAGTAQESRWRTRLVDLLDSDCARASVKRDELEVLGGRCERLGAAGVRYEGGDTTCEPERQEVYAALH